MTLVKRKLSDLIPYENNPRKNDDAVKAVAESIRQCGYVAPIIVDEDGVILAGHTRLRALQELGKKEADVIVKEGLTEEQKRKYRLLDNKTAEIAEWDFNALAAELEDLDFEGFDFGFDEAEFDEYGTDFSLKAGDKDTLHTMSITLSETQAEVVNEALRVMKGTQKYKDYEDPENGNSNGNALFLVVDEWLQQRT